MKLLIHYHDLVYVDKSENLFTSSNFGLWLNELSYHASVIGVIAHEAEKKLFNTNTKLKKNKFIFINLGLAKNDKGRFSKTSRVKKVCRKISSDWDFLLIRGFTSLQNVIWSNVNCKKKAFLLVRSPAQERILKFQIISLLAYIKNKYIEFTFNKILKSADVFLANAPQYFQNIGNKNFKEVRFTPTNLIHSSDYPDLSFRPLNSVLKILFVGRPTALKGMNELLEALSILKIKGIDFTIDICGTTNAKTIKFFKNKSIELNIKNNVNWIGYIKHGSEIFDYYKNSDILVLPSYTEGFPRVFWESAAHSLPCIITKVGGVPKLLKHKKHAFLISKKNSKTIYDAILTIIRSNSLRERIIRNAYKLSKKYPIEKCASILIKNLE